MSDKFTIVGFVTKALAESWGWAKAGEELARMLPGVEAETAAATMASEAYRYEADQLRQMREMGRTPTDEGARAVAREAAMWGVQAAIDDALPPTEPGTPEAKSTSYRHLGVTWAR